MLGMTHVQAKHIGAAIHQPANGFRRFRGRAEGANEFGFSGHDIWKERAKWRCGK
jgi:hypothetical protein